MGLSVGPSVGLTPPEMVQTGMPAQEHPVESYEAGSPWQMAVQLLESVTEMRLQETEGIVTEGVVITLPEVLQT